MSEQSIAAVLRADAATLATAATTRHLATMPHLTARYGAIAEVRCTEDGVHHLRQLAGALHAGRPELFTGYVAWAHRLLLELDLATADLTGQLATLADEIDGRFGARGESAVALLRDTAANVPAPVDVATSLLPTDGPAARLATSFLELVLGGRRREAIAAITTAVDDGMALETIYLEVFQPCLREVGRLWQGGRISVAQEHLVTAATQVAMAQLYPRLFATPRIGRTAVVASIGGELHEVGGRMVADLFELRGWTTVFAGANTPVTALVSLVADRQPDVVALSTTIGAHVPEVAETIDRLRATTSAHIITGGRAFLEVPDLWQAVGADGTAADALAAVALAHDLVEAA